MRFDSIRLALRLVLLTAAVAWPTSARAQKAPEPSPYPIAPELDIKVGTPKRVVVEVPGDLYPKAYWYLTYTVTNNGNKPYHFLPAFEMYTSDLKLIRGDKAIPHQVFDKIKSLERNKLLEPANKIETDIQPGEDQAHDGVAIWVEPMPRMGTFNIFVGGLSDEHVILKKSADGWMPVNAKTAGEELKGVDEKDRQILRKTLVLTYQVPGDEVRPGNDPVRFKGRRWVMRP